MLAYKAITVFWPAHPQLQSSFCQRTFCCRCQDTGLQHSHEQMRKHQVGPHIVNLQQEPMMSLLSQLLAALWNRPPVQQTCNQHQLPCCSSDPKWNNLQGRASATSFTSTAAQIPGGTKSPGRASVMPFTSIGICTIDLKGRCKLRSQVGQNCQAKPQ